MKVIVESSQLPSTKTEELKVIEQGVAGRPAEVEAVASLLPRTSIVHFACHGTQDRSKPLDSGLKLNDGLLRISRIMKETLTNRSLDFLCACETAMGDRDLPDEAMNLGASYLFSIG
jgi:CHAT domain-containing protein